MSDVQDTSVAALSSQPAIGGAPPALPWKPMASAVAFIAAVFGSFYGGYSGAERAALAEPDKPVATGHAPVRAVAASAPAPQLRMLPMAASAPASAASQPLLWPIWEYRLLDPLPAREQPLTPVSWRLLGAALFDGKWHVIVMRQGATAPEYLKVGDKLPGGYRIRSITQEDVTLVTGKREIILAYIGSR